MKKTFKILVILIVFVTLTACGKKTALTDNQMKSKLSDLDFTVNDVTKTMEDSNISVVRTANNHKYQIEYYIFKNNEIAQTAYENNVKMFEADNKNKVSKKSKDNYSKFVQKTNDYYNVVSRIDNTLIYVSINIDYRDDVNKVLNKLGY